MNINEIEKIIPKEKILQNVQMKKYTSFKIGGEAEVLIKISTLEELTKIIKYIKNGGEILLLQDPGVTISKDYNLPNFQKVLDEYGNKKIRNRRNK